MYQECLKFCSKITSKIDMQNNLARLFLFRKVKKACKVIYDFFALRDAYRRLPIINLYV